MLQFPQKDLYALNFFTIGHTNPMVIASYSPEQQNQIDMLDSEVKRNPEDLQRWCQRNKYRRQIIRRR